MLYTLVLIACFNGSPHSCGVREEIVQDLAGHPGVAFIQAQGVVASWLEAHPDYAVRRWRLHLGLRA